MSQGRILFYLFEDGENHVQGLRKSRKNRMEEKGEANEDNETWGRRQQVISYKVNEKEDQEPLKVWSFLQNK